MISFKYRFKNNKMLLIFATIIFAVLLFDLFVLIFDIIQFVAVSKNVTNRFSGFETLNIFAGILNICIIVAIVCLVIYSRKKLKVDVSNNAKKWFFKIMFSFCLSFIFDYCA